VVCQATPVPSKSLSGHRSDRYMPEMVTRVTGERLASALALSGLSEESFSGSLLSMSGAGVPLRQVSIDAFLVGN